MNQIATESTSSKSAWPKVVGFIGVLAALFLAARFLPVDEYFGRFLELVESLGPWGPILLAAVYVVATVLMTPGVILTLGAGFLFGLLVGTITVSAGSLLGATAAFLIGRTAARNFVVQQAEKFPRFAAVDKAVEKSGFKIVLLTRLSPLFPFNALNYLFSITKVRLRDYVLASWIGMLPGTVMYVYFGAAAKSLANLVRGEYEGGTAEKAFLAVGLIVTIAVTAYVTKLARDAMREQLPEKGGEVRGERGERGEGRE